MADSDDKDSADRHYNEIKGFFYSMSCPHNDLHEKLARFSLVFLIYIRFFVKLMW